MALDVIKTQKTEKGLSKKQSFTLAAACLVVGSAIFLTAYSGMRGSGIGVFNQPILDWMISHRFQSLTDVAKIVTTLASPTCLFVITGIIVTGWAMLKRELWRPFLLACAMITSALTSTFLKTVFMDTRPPQINMIPMFEMDYSFPSGHTLAASVFILTVGYLIYSRRFNMPKLTIWLSATLFGTGLIATSRLYLGYHWLTDVVASLGLGLVILTIVIAVDILINKTEKS